MGRLDAAGHARYVLDRRSDVLIVDDTNIVYEGWVTRERRIASLICERPVFILQLRDADLQPTRAAFRVEPTIRRDAAGSGQGDPRHGPGQVRKSELSVVRDNEASRRDGPRDT